MRRLIIESLVLGLCVVTAATAQERVPQKGSTAVGIDAGAFVPNAAQLDNSLLVNVLYEYYVSPRVSLRTDFGWTNPAFTSGGVDSLKQVPLRLNVNYNWGGGRWHPFVGTGVGLYFMQFKNNQQSLGETESKFGLSTGGGVEYFIHRNVTVKGEGRYQAIADARDQEPSGVSLTLGLKTYF